MAGLPFNQLPGTQPDPQFTGGQVQQAQTQQMQPQVPEVPKSTPGLILDNDLQQKLQYMKMLGDRIIASNLPQAEHDAAVDKLDAATNDVIFEHNEKVRKLQETQQLMDLGVLDSQKGEQALWNMVLPQEAAAAQPSLRVAEPGAPFAPSSLKNYASTAKEFALAAPSTGEWFTGSDNEPRSEEALLAKYRAWKQFIGYDALTPTKQRQVDGEWDATMKAKPKWKWDPASEAVRSERPQGPLSSAYMKKRPTALDGAGSNPISESIRKQVDTSLARQEKPKLTKEEAQVILLEAGGDKAKARQLATERGYRL